MNAIEMTNEHLLLYPPTLPDNLKSLRYMDDDFMAVCLADNFEGVELILRIVLRREDIKSNRLGHKN